MARKSTGSNRQHLITLITLAAMLGLLLGGIAKTEAASYTFTKIADTASPSNSPPALNDKGVVAFFPSMTGISTGDGTSTWTIADTSGPINFFFLSSPSLSDSGVLAFRVFLDTGVSAIVRTNGIMSTIIAEQGKGFRILGNHPSVNDDGAVAFLGFDSTGSGIFMGDGTTPTPIAHTPSPFWSFGDNPSLNDRGAVAFIAADATGTGIFRRDGTTTTTIAHTNGPYFSLGFFPSLNNEGAVAFLASLDAGGSGIFVSDGSATTKIAADSGPLLAFGSSPSINDKGLVAFWASLDAGGSGIFTGPDPGVHKVIAAGDALDGSTVKDLFFGREGLNNAGQVAFLARLVDGRRGIYRADPVPSEPEVLKVSIDIKPGGNPNSINPKSQGTVPIAILGTADFDATTVDPTTVTLAGAPVKLKKNGMLMYAYEDANGDGRVDLVVHMSTQDLRLDESSPVAVLMLTGQTFDKMPITGADTVRIVP